MLPVPPPPGAAMAAERVLVTGGAGFLGLNLVRHLLPGGWPLRTLDLAPFDAPERGQIDAQRGDIRDPGAVERAMAGVHTVVHAAAALPLAPASEILTTGVDGTRLLLQAAQRQGVARFIFTSSTAVYGIPDHHPIREGDALHGVGPYGQAKIAAERLCADARVRGLCVSILRPKSFVGPERLGAFELLYDWAADGHGFPVLGRADQPFQLLDVADLCEVIRLCMTLAPPRVDDTFNVGAERFGSLTQAFQDVLDHAGHGRRVVHLPERPARWLLRGLAACGLSPLYPWIVESAGRASVVSTDRLRHRLGFVPRYSNREALLRNFDWYLAHRAGLGAARGVSHRVPWRRGVLGVAKWLF